jgi:hypothetical protein
VTNGANVVVADVDTGVDYTHPDFVNGDSSSQLVNGYDEITKLPMGPGTTETGNTDVGQTDSGANGHGTAVAGVIAAATNNATGLASLGFHTLVMPIKVDFGTTATSGQIAAGIYWAADSTQHPSTPVKVINLSLGGACPDTTMQTAIQTAENEGVLVVAAAGNGALSPTLDTAEGTNNAPSYPAAYTTVATMKGGLLAVGATGRDGIRAFYSDTGPYVSMVAPGGSGDGVAADDIPLLAPGYNPAIAGSGYATGAGTSFASPEVAAAAALIWSVNSTLLASQVTQLLTGSATDFGQPGSDIEYGAGMLNASAALADTPPPTPGFGTFFSVPPARILNTLAGVGASKARVGPHSSINLSVAGVGGIPASGVSAVVLNVTAVNGTAPSYITVWPTGQPRPGTSNINFPANRIVPNLVTVKVGAGDSISLYNSAGAVDLLGDVAGYYVDGSGSPGSTYFPLAPKRIMNTITTGGPIVGPSFRSLTVAGLNSVPSSATAVVVNVEVTAPTASGYLTAFPEGTARPSVSNVNFVAGQTVPNLVTVKLGAGGGVNFYVSTGSVQVLVDLEGYFTALSDTTGSRYFPVVNHRILYTATNVGGYVTPIGPGQSIPVTVAGQGGVLADAVGVVMNTAVIGPTKAGYLTLYPDGQSRPAAANLTFSANETVANLVSADLGSDGKVQIFNRAGSVNVFADVFGWYGPAGT